MFFCSTFVSALIATTVVHACTDYSDIASRDTPLAEWSYDTTEGPISWHNLDTTYSLCGTGRNQSPIDLNHISAASENSTDYVLNYPTLRNVPFIGTHHTVQAQVSLVNNANNTLSFAEKTYTLAQFHFHVSSEHRIDGEYFPMEVHFVHSTAAGERAVMGFVIEIGGINDPFLGSVLSHIDELKGEDPKTVLPSLDFSTVVAQFSENSIFRYSGSLTTPPCSEGVEWIVSKKPLMLNAVTFNKAKKHLKFNSRYTQNVPGGKNLLE